MHIIYDFHGNRFKFCQDEDNEYQVEHCEEDKTLTVKHWDKKKKSYDPDWPTVSVFFNPRRWVKDSTL